MSWETMYLRCQCHDVLWSANNKGLIF
jgi:hypothetical protein